MKCVMGSLWEQHFQRQRAVQTPAGGDFKLMETDGNSLLWGFDKMLFADLSFISLCLQIISNQVSNDSSLSLPPHHSLPPSPNSLLLPLKLSKNTILLIAFYIRVTGRSMLLPTSVHVFHKTTKAFVLGVGTKDQPCVLRVLLCSDQRINHQHVKNNM